MGNMGAVFIWEVSMNPHPSCHNHIATNKENGFDISSWPAGDAVVTQRKRTPPTWEGRPCRVPI